MSQATDLVRKAWPFYASRDADRLLAHFAPDIEIDASELGPVMDTQLYRGHDGARPFYSDWWAEWETFDSSIDELIDCGSTVVALGRQGGVAKGSGASVEMEFAMTISIEDGQVTRMHMHLSRERALRASAEGR